MPGIVGVSNVDFFDDWDVWRLENTSQIMLRTTLILLSCACIQNKLAELERTAHEAGDRERYLAEKQRLEQELAAEQERVKKLKNLLAKVKIENNNLSEEIETQREIEDSCEEQSNTIVRLEMELNQTRLELEENQESCNSRAPQNTQLEQENGELKSKLELAELREQEARIGTELAIVSATLEHQMELAQANPTEVTTKTPAVKTATEEIDAGIAMLATGIYYFNSHFMSWEMARSVCRSKDWIWAWTSACLSWETQDERWLSTNQIVAYTNWGQGDPDRGKRDCIQLNIENGTWYDYIKIDKVSSICEFTRA
ncbi:hypothetical protein B566_EDAN012217 [Ephemera danica]|nr:hypothetical protein B566_EDAN012217 [Ephemera danica]